MSFINSPALSLLKQLADKYTAMFYILRSNKKKAGLAAGKPGEIIGKLSPEEREVLKTLSSDETQKQLLNESQAGYICSDYWEKKAEEDRYKEYTGFKQRNNKGNNKE